MELSNSVNGSEHLSLEAGWAMEKAGRKAKVRRWRTKNEEGMVCGKSNSHC